MGLFSFFKNWNSPTPEKLIKASRKGNLKLVNSLLENGVDVNSRDENGWTPLMWASFKNHGELITTLLEKGADINAQGNEGVSALTLAAENGWVNAVKTLVAAGADVNAKENKGRSASFFALDNGWVEALQILLDAGAELDGQDKDDALTLLSGHSSPPPVARPPFPEFATKHDLSLEVEVKNRLISLEISASSCSINWGDDSVIDVYSNINKKIISHKYPKTSNYPITIDASGLTSFSCVGTEFDITSIYLNNCPKIESLHCYLNKLTVLDVTQCPALKFLSCGDNQLATLNLNNNLDLIVLHCKNNLLKILDISNNNKLEFVDCSSNQLSMLIMNSDIHLSQLQCNKNQLSKYELNLIFNKLPNFNSSYASVSTWYNNDIKLANIFCACGDNPGFDSCNRKIAQNKNWLIWRKAMYSAPTLAGTPGCWVPDFLNN
jgi:hypothetical protein